MFRLIGGYSQLRDGILKRGIDIPDVIFYDPDTGNIIEALNVSKMT